MAAAALLGAALALGFVGAQPGVRGAATPVAAAPAPTAASLPAASGEAMAHTCAACHGTQGRLGDEAFMPLAGMPPAQFVRTMQDFRSGQRPSTLMGHVAQGFGDADLRAMAAYFAAIPPLSTDTPQGAAR